MSRIYEATQRPLKDVVTRMIDAQAVPADDTFAVPAPARRRSEPAVDPTQRAVEEGYERLAQSVRAFWSGRHLFQFGLASKVLLVASAVPQEGASTVARRLAERLAVGNGRAVLVDANLRMPSQHEAMGVERRRGLSDLLHGVVDAERAVHEAGESGLALLTAGRPADNPAALLGSEGARAAIQELSTRFEWVVIDGPPVTVYSDAAILARLADATILVVKAEATRFEVVEQAKRMLEDTGTPLLGAVLNRRQHHIPGAIYRRIG